MAALAARSFDEQAGGDEALDDLRCARGRDVEKLCDLLASNCRALEEHVDNTEERGGGTRGRKLGAPAFAQAQEFESAALMVRGGAFEGLEEEVDPLGPCAAASRVEQQVVVALALRFELLAHEHERRVRPAA